MGCMGFAQAPQALVLKDRLRVYFSTRALEADSGKYLSHVAYVDLSKDLKEVLQVSRHCIIPLGKLGCFDEHGIFPMNVVRKGQELLGFTSGVNRRVSVPVDGAIGLAYSFDEGETFQRAGDGPVLAPSLNEPCIVVDPFVFVDASGLLHMWYVFGRGWKHSTDVVSPSRVYKIGHAVSSDGISWAKTAQGQQVLQDALGPDECQAMPTVASFGGSFHMMFCYREASDFRKNSSRGYRMGHARSTDLLNWTRCDDELALPPGALGEWDAEMQCYPHLVQIDGETVLLYNGNAFGREGFGAAVLEA